MILKKKTKRELALEFIEDYNTKGTSKDETKVWVSQESLIKRLNFFLTLIDGTQESNKTNTFDAHLYIDEIIEELKR